MKIAAPLFLVYLTFVSLAQTPTEPGFQTTFKQVERIGEANETGFFVFSAGDLTYTIRHDGFGDTTAPRFLRKRVFRLQLGGDGRLSRMYTAEFAGDSILAYEVTSGRAYLARLDQNTRTFHWFVGLGTNIDPGVIEDRYVYLSGQDFVAKIDIDSGKYVWQLTNLKQQYGTELKGFGLPEIRSASVIFREEGTSGRAIEVDKISGQIVKALP